MRGAGRSCWRRWSCCGGGVPAAGGFLLESGSCWVGVVLEGGSCWSRGSCLREGPAAGRVPVGGGAAGGEGVLPEGPSGVTQVPLARRWCSGEWCLGEDESA